MTQTEVNQLVKISGMRTSNFFFLLISPPRQVMEYVSYLKKRVWRRLGHSFDSLHSKAHLTLFQYYDFYNEAGLYIYQEIISSIKPFEIQIKNFNVFGNNGTIYLDIEHTHDICALAERLGHPIKPHITIAKNLARKDFNQTWSELKRLSYNCRFLCDHVTVLMRLHDRWVPHSHLSLKQL